VLAGTVSVLNKILLEFVHKAVAYRCIYRGGMELSLQLSELGFYKSETVATKDNAKTNMVDVGMLQNLIERAEKNGHAYIKACEGYLRKNTASYPLYIPSTASSVFALQGTNKIGII